jgi:hypothetical protein
MGLKRMVLPRRGWKLFPKKEFFSLGDDLTGIQHPVLNKTD